MQASSQDNLAAVAGNTACPAEMYVPPTFTPPGKKAGIGVTIKSTPTVLKKKKTEETQMEVNEQTPSTTSGRPPVPAPKAVKIKDLKMSVQSDEAAMKQWTHDMLSGHPGG